MASNDASYYNGDRFVFIKEGMTPPFPKESTILGHKFRIWHPTQNLFCKRCTSYGHNTKDLQLCPSNEFDPDVVAFRSDSNPLSNYYKCDVKFDDRVFKSSEHAYLYTKCFTLLKFEQAEAVFNATKQPPPP